MKGFFTGHDGWILLSLFHSQGKSGAGLRDLLSVADMINHAVPSREIVEGTVRRLRQAGIAKVVGGSIIITPSAKRAIKKRITKTAAFLAQIDRVEEYLRDTDFTIAASDDFTLDEELYRNAFEAYMKGFR